MPTSRLSLHLPWAQLQLKPKRLLLPQARLLPWSRASPGTSTTWSLSHPHVQPHFHVGPFTCSSHKGGSISFPAQTAPSSSPAALPTTTAEMLTRKPILPPSPGPLQQGLTPRVLSHQPPGSLPGAVSLTLALPEPSPGSPQASSVHSSPPSTWSVPTGATSTTPSPRHPAASHWLRVPPAAQPHNRSVSLVLK